METGDTTSNCHAHVCMYEHERAHVAQALVHHQREWACLKCESSCTHWHDWKPKTSMECGNVKYCKLRPHDVPQVFKSILPICWNIHFRKGLPCQHAGELRDSQCWPSFEVSRTGALPKDGRATCDRAGCECLPRRFGAVVALGLLGDPYPFWCTIYIGWFSLLGRQTERQACLLPRRGVGASPFSAQGFHWVTQKHHNLIDFVQLPSFHAPIRKSQAEDTAYDQPQRLLARLPLRIFVCDIRHFFQVAFPWPWRSRTAGSAVWSVQIWEIPSPKWPVQCGWRR